LRTRSFRHILKETSISHIIKQLRVLNAACKSTRTAEEWEALEKENKLMAYSDLETDVDPFICFKKNPNEHIENPKSSQKCDSRESELYSTSKLA